MKADRPFKVGRTRGIIRLALDTPRAPVNIFDRAAAEQLIEVLSALPSDARAIVFESAKPGSFINGARLMMASTVRSLDSAHESAKPVLVAYDLVERAPVPTIALVRGTCFGCGVEFTLRCRHRLAIDAIETQFYMTELADYLLSPAFGSVSRLPKLLGLDRAADFLLWGERWTANEALAAGLVDRIAHDGSDREIEQFLARPLARRKRRSLSKKALARHRARIERLPPAYQPLFRACLDEMASGGAGELALSAKTTAQPMAKAALGFFFVRQIATSLSRRGTIELRTESTSVRAIARAYDLRLSRSITGKHAGRAIHHPDRLRRRALVEVANAGKESASAVEQLERAGFVAFSSSPKQRYAIDALLMAHFAPIVRALDRGVEVAAINQTLRTFGFVQRPHDLIERFSLDRIVPQAALEALRDPSFGRRSDRRLLDELCLSWTECALDLLNGTINHPTIVDLAARELLDFPLQHRSLCSFLTRERVKSALERTKSDHLLAARYAKGDRDFYA